MPYSRNDIKILSAREINNRFDWVNAERLAEKYNLPKRVGEPWDRGVPQIGRKRRCLSKSIFTGRMSNCRQELKRFTKKS